jgi:hypothetical protein
MEDKMLDMKIEGGGEGCLMTCYLEYRKEGDTEFLEGTYTSKNMNNGTDCGGGRVRLERVMDSDFEKEDFLKSAPKEEKSASNSPKSVKPGQEEFLVKKPAAKTPAPSSSAKPKTPPVAGNKPPVKKSTPAPASASKTKTPPPASTAKKPATTSKPATSTAKASPPQTKSASATKPPAAPAKPPVVPDVTQSDKPNTNKAAEEMVKAEPPIKTIVPKPAPPPVLKNRTNELFETIVTDAREIKISFYDNGEIDGDTITVFDNNRQIVSHRGLSANPISLSIKLNEDDPDHEIIMVAENMGTIPPNTALMIVQAGSKRYTLRLASTEQKNAMVRFRYEAKSP